MIGIKYQYQYKNREFRRRIINDSDQVPYYLPIKKMPSKKLERQVKLLSPDWITPKLEEFQRKCIFFHKWKGIKLNKCAKHGYVQGRNDWDKKTYDVYLLELKCEKCGNIKEKEYKFHIDPDYPL